MIADQLKKLSSRKYKFLSLEKVAQVLAAFSLTERVIFSIIAVVFSVSAFTLLWQLNVSLTVEVPASGGEVVEGVIGIPRFINPLLAISDADRDLTTLVYSGLMKTDASGKLITDLAESYNVSENGLAYTFTLRPDVTFHDGRPVTANDVIFTIKKAQDPNLKSPKRASWEGVTAEKIDDRTVKITLKQVYAPFLVNTTMGIVPQHVWQNVDAEQFTFSQFNIEPIGSGPYKIKTIKRNSGGVPLSYTLIPFNNYALGEPFISTISMKFYTSEDALIDAYEQGSVHAINSISPYKALALKALGARIESISLPRIFGVFFNQNEAPVFTHQEIRTALDKSVDREKIVAEVLSGYGIPIHGPLPTALIPKDPSAPGQTFEELLQSTKTLLEKNGWKPSSEDGVLEKTVKKETVRFEFTISTSNTPELKAAAKILKEGWEKIGAKVELNIFDVSDLNQNIIRPRKYQALFFGEVVGRDLDLFAFWHSSQRNDPGLNIALYTNIKADKLLESARTILSDEERLQKYNEFAEEVKKDVPTVFVYSPDFIYVLPQEIKGVSLQRITVPSDRFLNVNDWYIETDRVWNILSEEKNKRYSPRALGTRMESAEGEFSPRQGRGVLPPLMPSLARERESKLSLSTHSLGNKKYY